MVLPLDSGPKISVTRPRGIPPMPIAASRLIAPVEMALTRTCGESAPIRMMEPFPQVFSIWVMAKASALRRSSEILVGWVGCVGCSAMSDLDMGGEPLWFEARIYTETAVTAIRDGRRPPGALSHCPLAQYSRSDTRQTDAQSGPSRPARPSRFAPLAPVTASNGLPNAQSRPSLHFHKGDEHAPPGDEVDLDATNPKPVRDHLPATGLEVADRLLFAARGPPMPRVRPARWITVHAARHGAKVSSAPEGRITKFLHYPLEFAPSGPTTSSSSSNPTRTSRGFDPFAGPSTPASSS